MYGGVDVTWHAHGAHRLTRSLAEYATDRPSLRSLTDETDPNDGNLKLLIAAEGGLTVLIFRSFISARIHPPSDAQPTSPRQIML